MKKLLLAVIAVLSLNAYSQSYIIMDNGITVTTDNSGYTYDFGHYAYPEKVVFKGGQFFVEEGGILATIDENGLLFRKYELIPQNIKGKGINYFLSAEGFLYGIDKKGFVQFSENELFKKALNFGGNYFTVATDDQGINADLYVVTAEGKPVKASIPSLVVKDIISYGGTYFMNNRGIVFTVSIDGQVTPRDDMRIGILTKKGGNYFVDSSNTFYTVTESGEIIMPALPINLKITSIHRLGSTYFLDLNGKLYTVDKKGNVYERVMRDHDFHDAKIISL